VQREIPNIFADAGLNPDAWLVDAGRRIQPTLRRILAARSASDIARRLTSPMEKTFFANLRTPEAAAWLTASPALPFARLPNAVFRHAASVRVGADAMDVRGACPACLKPQDTFHKYVCERRSGGTVGRHHRIRNALRNIAARATGNPARLEPTLTHPPTNWRAAPGLAVDDCRGDILVDFGDAPNRYIMVDTTVRHPNSGHPPEMPRATATAAEIVKVRQYLTRFPHVNKDLIVPFALETTGAFGLVAKNFIRKLATCKDRPNTCAYRTFLRETYVRLSVQLQLGVFEACCWVNQRPAALAAEL
jgi:hypothetical protein